jgi:hypothetical protein
LRLKLLIKVACKAGEKRVKDGLCHWIVQSYCCLDEYHSPAEIPESNVASFRLLLHELLDLAVELKQHTFVALADKVVTCQAC